MIQEQQLKQIQNLRKKVKLQFQNQPFGQQIYLEKQKLKLQQFLQSLKQYTKITALMIQHQQKSIKTLPKQILQRFTQLGERVSRSIECCKKNTSFLQIFKITVQKSLKLKRSPFFNAKVNDSHFCGGVQHSHSLQQISPNRLLNIFNHFCRQYSQQQIHMTERLFIKFITQNISEFMDQKNLNQGQTTTKILVLGCGMGRSVFEINKLFKTKGLPIASSLVQGHQQEQQYYLMSEFMLNGHSQQIQALEIYPYIHNFSNHLKQDTPYTLVQIPLPKPSQIPIPFTFGSYNQLYKSHTQAWSVVVSTFFNYYITDVLQYIQLVYKMLKKGGIWIDICTSTFQKHLIPYFSYGQYENILDKSQFKLIKKISTNQFWYMQPHKIMKQYRTVHYRIMKKQ